jgi:hypothetical protein
MHKLAVCICLISACLVSPIVHASEEITACSIVDRGDVEKAAGVQLGIGQLTTFDAKFMQGTTLCHFESLDGKHYKRFVNIELTEASSADEAKQKYDDALAITGSAEPINGLGDQAAWGDDIGRPRGGLNILHTRYYLEIKVNREDGKQNRNQAIFLARKILADLD